MDDKKFATIARAFGERPDLARRTVDQNRCADRIAEHIRKTTSQDVGTNDVRRFAERLDEPKEWLSERFLTPQE